MHLCLRQASGSNVNQAFELSSSKRNVAEADLQVSRKELQYFGSCDVRIIIIILLAKFELQKINVLVFCCLPAFSATSCQSRALPMGRPGSCGLHHHTPAHKGHLQNGRYHTAQYAKLNALQFVEQLTHFFELRELSVTSNNIMFHPGRYNLQLWPGRQFKFPRVLLDISDAPGEKRQPTHGHPPPQ